MAPSRILKALALFCATSCFTNAQTDTPAVPDQPTPSPAPTWGGCMDSNMNPLVTIGEKTTICLVLSNGVNWNGQTIDYIRLSFQPIADEFSRFIVPASYRHLINDRSAISKLGGFADKDIAIHASSQQAFSFQKLYFDQDEGKIYPQLTAIIDVVNGVVEGITWDDGCIFCKDLECGTNTFEYNGEEAALPTPTGGCGKDKATCDEGISGQSTVCDIAFHVVWTGTDSEGTPFQSSAYRFSAFPQQDFVDSLNIPTSFSDLGISLR
ncbi:MAG: hypothetical protein SGBAC_011989 [Bacillariaceae sp.]